MTSDATRNIWNIIEQSMHEWLVLETGKTYVSALAAEYSARQASAKRKPKTSSIEIAWKTQSPEGEYELHVLRELPPIPTSIPTTALTVLYRTKDCNVICICDAVVPNNKDLDDEAVISRVVQQIRSQMHSPWFEASKIELLLAFEGHLGLAFDWQPII